MTYLRTLLALVRREPIRTFAVVRSAIAVGLAFYPGLINPDQTAAVLTLAVAWLGIDEVVRQQTTSTAAPKLPLGSPVLVQGTRDSPPADAVVALRSEIRGAQPE